MLKAQTKWKVKDADKAAVKKLKDELSVSALTARLLVNRGIDTARAARHFLHMESFPFHDPFLLDGMQKAVARIEAAISNKERILIFGDYDADGVTSTALLVHLMRELQADFETYIPNRFTEGYGPNEAAFRFAKQQGVHVIVTVDTGISALYEAEVASELGIDLIITDHHEPPPTLPDAYAIINPKKPGCPYPFKGLAGVGVAFKLAHALLGQVPLEWLDLVAIGTIADLVPLIDENRKIVIEGMKWLAKTERPGMKALLAVCRVKGKGSELNADRIAFAVAPRLNAAGRLASAEPALHLLISTDEREAQSRAEKLNELNKERQAIVEETTKDALHVIAEESLSDRIIVVAKEGWNPGVVGIVASRLVERFRRPVIVLAIDSQTGMAQGSGRSIAAFDLFSSLSACRELLLHFGGHSQAAGLTVSSHDIAELRIQLNEWAQNKTTAEDFIPISMVDAICRLDEITVETIAEISKLAPFGAGNPTPHFLIENATLAQAKKVGVKENHLKFQLKENDSSLHGIGFRWGELFHEVSPGATVSVIGELAINEWNGFRNPQLLLADMAVDEWQLFDFRGVRDVKSKLTMLSKEKVTFVSFRQETIASLGLADWQVDVVHPQNADPTSVQRPYIVFLDLPYTEEQLKTWYRSLPRLERTYVVFHHQQEHFFTAVPSRDQFKWYYAFLFKRETFSLQKAQALANYKGWAAGVIEFMSKVFLELGFVTINNGMVAIVKQPRKKKLTNSNTYRQKLEMVQLEKLFLYSSYESLKRWFSNLHHSPNVEEAMS